jgi:heme-degrading monooxygenase HmoA
MIMRIWHGTTARANGDSFFRYVLETGVPWYCSLEGNLGVMVLRKDEAETCEFMLLSLWNSLEEVRKFAGPDPDRAIYNFAKDRELLLELEPTVAHYQILADLRPAGPSCDKSIKYSIIV